GGSFSFITACTSSERQQIYFEAWTAVRSALLDDPAPVLFDPTIDYQKLFSDFLRTNPARANAALQLLKEKLIAACSREFGRNALFKQQASGVCDAALRKERPPFQSFSRCCSRPKPKT